METDVLRFVILALLAFWWWALIRAFVARGGNAFGEWPISSQITGKFSEPFDIAFFGMAAAVLAFPFAIRAAAPWVLGIASLAAAGCIGTMLTRRVWPNERAHITLAGLAFGAGGASVAASAFVSRDWIMLGLACATMVPAAVTVASNLRPLHLWMRRFSRMEWATAVLLTSSYVIGCVFLR